MLIPIDEIEFTERSTLEDIESLMESIKAKGLLHAITVQALNGKYRLIAGEKRLRACKLLDYKEIPAEVHDAETEEDILEIQIHENLKRHNLSWYDQATLITRLHDLRQLQAGRPVAHRPAKENLVDGKKIGWSLRDTAHELGMSLGLTSEMIALEKAVQDDPSLRNVKDRTTAMKLIRVKVKQQDAEHQAGAIIHNFESDQVLLGDSEQLLKHYPPNIFDACITDPPWLEFKDNRLIKDKHTESVFSEVYRVLKQNSFLYMFLSTDDFIVYREVLKEIGFTVQKYPCIWYKTNQISMGTRSWEYNRDCELILVAIKGSPTKIISTARSSLFTYPIVPPQKMIHPNEKPIKLIKCVITDCTYEDSLILDPFGGSGVVAHACRTENRRYITIEREKEFYDKIVRRLDK